MLNFIIWFFYFIIYSFLGYICEVIYVSISLKKLTNRGYLYGPIVPIYGFGAILILLILFNLKDYPILVILLGFLITSSLEYITSFLMELLFHMRWWDYSNKFLNLNGRICLKNSLMFLALVLIVIYGIHPLIINFVLYTTSFYPFYLILFIILMIILIVDTIFSTIKHIKISTIINKLEKFYNDGIMIIDDIKRISSENVLKAKEYIKKTKAYQKLTNISIRYPSLKLKNDIKENITDFIEKIKNKFGGYKDE